MTYHPKRSGLMILLSSPSGAGKSTLARRLQRKDDTIEFSVSATTRGARPGEVDGQDYHFKSRDEFLKMIDDGDMLEHAEVFGNLYGTPRAPVEQALDAGRDVIFDVDWQGGQQVRASSLGSALVSVFILPPSIAALEERLRNRGQDDEETIKNRMSKSMAEISHWAEYDYVLVNDNIDTCEQELWSILTGERHQRRRQLGLVDFVRGLNSEFEALS